MSCLVVLQRVADQFCLVPVNERLELAVISSDSRQDAADAISLRGKVNIIVT